MAECLSNPDAQANPASATHGPGLAAQQLVEAARAGIAALIGAAPREIIFTSGATEANNLALLGAANAARRASRSARAPRERAHRAQVGARRAEAARARGLRSHAGRARRDRPRAARGHRHGPARRHIAGVADAGQQRDRRGQRSGSGRRAGRRARRAAAHRCIAGRRQDCPWTWRRWASTSCHSRRTSSTGPRASARCTCARRRGRASQPCNSAAAMSAACVRALCRLTRSPASAQPPRWRGHRAWPTPHTRAILRCASSASC